MYAVNNAEQEMAW